MNRGRAHFDQLCVRYRTRYRFYFRIMFAILMRAMLDGSDGSTFNATTVQKKEETRKLVLHVYLIGVLFE
jgi:hypothetical protein